MPLLPYCILRFEDTDSPATGIQDRPIRSLEHSGLIAIYSELEPREISGDQLQAAALKFHEVLQTIFKRQGLIPFRFPTFLSQPELRDHLSKESTKYLTFFHEHADDVQMEVRLWRTPLQQPKAESGTEYLTNRAKRKAELMAASDYVKQVAADTAKRWMSNNTRDEVRMFALVPRRRVEAFHNKLRDRPRPANVSMRITGPWPATQFLSGSESGVSHNVMVMADREKR
jgi:hypothetical protein